MTLLTKMVTGRLKVAGRIGDMNSDVNTQKGFTLIEALIAFLVLTVGLLGGLLFHSSLIKESGQSKSQIEAFKIAERAIEQQRDNTLYPTAAALQAALSSLSASSVEGTSENYTVSWGTPTAVSGAGNAFDIDLTVTWSVGSLSLQTIYSWIDPDNVIEADKTGGGTADEYSGSIPLPTGTLEAIERLEVVNKSEVTSGAIRTIGDALTVYTTASGATNVAVKLDDDTYIQLAQLSDPDNEILSISGRVYNYPFDDARLINQRFDQVFKPEGGDYIDDILDVRATAGANCLITRFENASFGNGNNAAEKGLFADYLCVAGTGWNGTIKPYIRDFDGTRFSDIDITDLVCAPRTRGYRYYLLQVADVNQLDVLIPDVGVSRSIQSVLNFQSNGASLATRVGQSGLVRFVASSAQKSSEQSFWEGYIWQSPDYIVSPYSTDNRAPGASTAAGGYLTHGVISGSAYSINFPGDVAYQNFILSIEGTGGSKWDCDDVITNFNSGVSTEITSKSKPNYFPFISEPTPHYDAAFYANLGSPGYDSTDVSNSFGYVPSSANSSNYDEDDYNTFDASVSQVGVTVLGYTLATNTVSGELKFPSFVSGGYTAFEIGANPEPVVSIVCTIDPNDISNESPADIYKIHEYTCSVPNSWRGNVYAFEKSASSSLVSCESTSYLIGNDSANPLPDPLQAASLSETSYQKNNDLAGSLLYYYEKYLTPQSVVSAGSFSTLNIQVVSAAVTSDDVTRNLSFNYCP